TNNDGGDVIIDANSFPTEDGIRVFHVTGVQACALPIYTNAEAIAYSNATSGLAATEVQAAIDELAGGQGTIDLVDNGDGKVTLVKPDGTTATVDRSDDNTTGLETRTYTNCDRRDVIIAANTLTITAAGALSPCTQRNPRPKLFAYTALSRSYSNATSGLAATEVQAAIDELAGGQGTIDLVDNGDGKVTLVKPDGTTATVD